MLFPGHRLQQHAPRHQHPGKLRIVIGRKYIHHDMAAFRRQRKTVHAGHRQRQRRIPASRRHQGRFGNVDPHGGARPSCSLQCAAHPGGIVALTAAHIQQVQLLRLRRGIRQRQRTQCLPQRSVPARIQKFRPGRHHALVVPVALVAGGIAHQQIHIVLFCKVVAMALPAAKRALLPRKRAAADRTAKRKHRLYHLENIKF